MYRPDSLTHERYPGCTDSAWCLTCRADCSESFPCKCCQSETTIVDISAEPQAKVRFVSDGDAGFSGEANG